jgi:putative sigma-54 modulation protein
MVARFKRLDKRCLFNDKRHFYPLQLSMTGTYTCSNKSDLSNSLQTNSFTIKNQISMMKINVKAIHFQADVKLITFIEEKLSRLSRFFKRPVEVEVLLKLQDNGTSVQEKVTEIRLHAPGGWLMDKKTSRTFESALTASVDTLKRQLVRQKEKTAA